MSTILRRRQTTGALAQGLLSLPVTKPFRRNRQDGLVSPYFQRSSLQEIGTGRDTNISNLMIKAFIASYLNESGGAIGALALVQDSDGTYTGSYAVPLTITSTDTDATIAAQVQTAAVTYFALVGFTADSIDTMYSTPSSVAAQISAALPVAPSSYQTIVTQTGTGAPAVSGSLTPSSTYPSGTTFTWARTGAGVYTLTASAAVFNTSGKTGVFVGTLNNLNASCKAVVTSSTVITLTTAIGSLLGLGLLGLTATNTDALLTQTMVYVQTY